ncbi:hypothetical protein LCGC14_1260410 [marine sediment metagenome]|uniref:Uncharacterized protein n=1 Tax=marine sediment metagenome TaxID=412755 RepID=A0A0F9P4B4_9ZZZZ
MSKKEETGYKRELKKDIREVDVYIYGYKEIPRKDITGVIKPSEETLSRYIEDFEVTKNRIELNYMVQQASNYAIKETNHVIDSLKHQILLATMILKLKTFISLLKKRLV